MKILFIAIFLLGAGWNAAHGQHERREGARELRWGEFGCYSNWERYPYGIKSGDEFMGRLPDLREFPKLLEAAMDPKRDESDRGVILSQMRTLSRCDFGKRALNAEDDAAAEYRAAVAKWKEWWERYGVKLAERLAEGGGVRDEKAWKRIAPGPYVECPKYPIDVPQAWSSTLRFRSGDYGGVTEEVIEFRVGADGCWLTRLYRTGWHEGAWTRERWENFSRGEAEHFLAALFYLIDNPWFMAGDGLSDKKEGEGVGHIRGRPAAWTDYYPSCEWSGILDAGGAVLMNHDPRTWDTVDYELGPKTSLGDGSIGVVFRLVRDFFPDASWDNGSSRWRKVEGDVGEGSK